MLPALVRRLFAALFVLAAMHAHADPSIAPKMRAAAEAIIASVDAGKRSKLVLPFASESRVDWHYIPRSRPGLSFADLNAAQRDAVHQLLRTGLSAVGHRKVVNIVELELVLREIETFGSVMRDPEKYFLVVFGEPHAANPWGWRFEGHHLSLNFTLRGQHHNQAIATTPSFFGANPAEVPLAAARMASAAEGFDTVRFAWAGATEKGKPHYYRVQGPKFLIEYDASQNDGNHIHTVWRDFDGDFGRDLLREHHAIARGTSHRH